MNAEILAVAGIIFLFFLAAGVLVFFDMRAWRSAERDRGFEVIQSPAEVAKEEPE